MALLKPEQILEILPSLFEINLNDKRKLFNCFEKFLIFDDAFIYFANPDSLQLKYSYKNHMNYEIEKVFPIDLELKQFVFNKESKILTGDSDLVDAIELKGSRQKSYLISKIMIKSTVFGIIVLSKREENFYDKSENTGQILPRVTIHTLSC